MIITEKTKFEQLSAILREDIKTGKYKSGDKIPSEIELAREYGLNRETVNKAVSNLVAAGLLTRKRGCGTYVAVQKDKINLKIGCVICPSVVNATNNQPIEMFNYVDVFSGISKASRDFDCELEIISVEKFCLHAGDILNFVEEKNLVGIVSFGYGASDKNIIRTLKNRSIPFVVISCWDSGLETNLVTVDMESGTRSIVEYLFKSGHRKVAVITGSTDIDMSLSPRINGIRNALSEFRIFEKELFIEINKKQITAKDIGFIIKNSKSPSAIITTTDITAFTVCKLLKHKGVKVPEDISLISIDDIEKASYYSPQLTTLKIPRQKMGYEAVKLCIMLANHKSRTFEKLILDTELIIRESVKMI